LDFALSENQKALRKTILAFAAREIAPGAEKRDATGLWDQSLWAAIGKLGILGLPVPERYGGAGADAVTTLAALEALGEGGLDTGLCVSVGAHVVLVQIPVLLYGSEAQREKYLPGLCCGDYIGAFALTEPEAGSDAAGIQTSVRREGDRYVLNGAKTFITNAPVADVLIAFATADRSRGADGISAFLVEAGTPGYSPGRKLAKMGNHASPTGEPVFDDCRLPLTALLGEEGKGFSEVAATALLWERAVFFGGLLGVLRGTLQKVLAYTRQRRQFNRPLADFQLVRGKLADMAVRIQAARMLAYHAAWCLDNAQAADLHASIAKLYTTEAAVEVLRDALEIYGGYGYMKEYPVERIYREMAVAPVGGGTSSIHRLIIANRLLKGIGLET
jgi:alkylation response protein AidB-like acyl-CoA dehydrogenase